MKRFFTALAMSFLVVLSLGMISYKTASPLTQKYYGRQEQVYGATVDASTLTASDLTRSYNLAEKFTYSGALPTGVNTTELPFSLIDNSPELNQIAFSKLVNIGYAGWGDTTPELELSSVDGSTTYTTTLNGSRYKVNETISGLESLEFNDDAMYLTVKDNYTGTISLRYRIKTDTTYTEYKTLTAEINNIGIYFVSGYNGVIYIDADDIDSYTFDDAFFRNYIIGGYNNGTIIDKSELIIGNETDNLIYVLDGQIDKTLYNTNQPIGVHFTYSDGGNTRFARSSMYVYIEKDIPQEDIIDVYINNSLVQNTSASDRFTIDISAGASFNGYALCENGTKNCQLELSSTDYFSISSKLEGMEDKEDTSSTYFKKLFSIFQREPKVGTFDLTLVASDPITEISKNIYLRVNVSTTVAPVINLNQTIMQIDKGTDLTGIKAMFRDNIRSIVLYNGQDLDGTIIADETKVIITCNITSSDVGGRYNIYYSYTDEDTGLQGTASAILEVVDNSPVISNVVARQVSNDEQVINGGELVLSTAIYFEVTAQDDDGDPITYFASVNKGTLVQDSEDPSVFHYEPNDRIAGTITFTFNVTDGYSSSDSFVYTIVYKDNIPPTITLKEEVKLIDGEYYLNVNRKNYIYFRNYIENVSDNSSTLSSNDVVITTQGFTFSDAQERYSFTKVGDYSVTYTLKDESNNSYSITVKIRVENQVPTGKNHEYEFGCGEEVRLPLALLVTDDTDGFAVVLSGFVTDIDGNNLSTDIFKITDDGTVTLKMSKVHNDAQNKDLPYVGKVYFRYKVIDSDNVESSLYIITVNFKDLTKPVLTRTDKTTRFIKGRAYDDFSPYGYFKAVDEIDGELDVYSITIYNGSEVVTKVSFDKVDEYTIKYVFKDSAGNIAEGTVNIEIVLGGRPSIELLATESTIALNGNFDIYNFIYKISDEEDGDITSGFKALRDDGSLNIDDRAVDTSKVGTYVIKMYYVDSDGNVSPTIEFTLTVEKPKEFPIQIIYYGAGGLGLVLLIVVIRIIAVKRKMRI